MPSRLRRPEKLRSGASSENSPGPGKVPENICQVLLEPTDNDTAVSSRNTVLRPGGTLVVLFQSYCFLAHSYLRNGQTECDHIRHNDSRDIIIVHLIGIPILLSKFNLLCFGLTRQGWVIK